MHWVIFSMEITCTLYVLPLQMVSESDCTLGLVYSDGYKQKQKQKKL